MLIDVKISCDLVACKSSHSGNRLKLVIYSTTILSLSYLSVLHILQLYFHDFLSGPMSYGNKQSFVGFFGGFDGDFILSIYLSFLGQTFCSKLKIEPNSSVKHLNAKSEL